MMFDAKKPMILAIINMVLTIRLQNLSIIDGYLKFSQDYLRGLVLSLYNNNVCLTKNIMIYLALKKL